MTALTICPYTKINKEKKGQVGISDLDKMLTEFFSRETVVLNSARLGILEVLRFFDIRRREGILIPDFLSQCILNILNKSSFPVKKADETTRVVLLLHQWGYPQKMKQVIEEAKKRNLIVIEDCAHTFDSKYQGQKVGTFGEAAVYSFSKLFPTGTGGCLVSKNKALVEIVKEKRKKDEGIFLNLLNKICQQSLKKAYTRGKLHDNNFIELCYSQYFRMFNANSYALKLFPFPRKELEAVLAIRKENYLNLVKRIKQDYIIPDHDSDIEVNPLCLPVFPPLTKIPRIIESLKDKGVAVEAQHFDTNRNTFDPHYQKCLAIPCHQYLKVEDMENIISVINEA
ncbi:MAG: DegT/DnrJ/EryC1/StrS family aminotransferase [Candidatus Staskawiczbacteria bacterium]|nr:DegT/DnrJ/EryC1/StrS family aminotransferase [Candidatus Staskawiczbacteria bacterium]